MGSLLRAIIVGLVGAGIVHGLVLLIIPHVTEGDVWTRLESRAPFYEVVRIDPASGGNMIHLPDPLFEAAACRIDLSEGIVHLEAEGDVPYWSMSIYDRSGQNIFSINDRTSNEGRLDFLVATSAQLTELRNSQAADFGTAVFVETEVQEGIVVVRAFVPDPTFEPTISRYLAGLDCSLR
ncbi:MAG: DUF1254 domain-containing protein [Rhizobiaceae bacterium]|nr:DUF1254 domain-containing protein [Rhizobiaceae bacterium]